MGFLLFILASIMWIPLSFINFFHVLVKYSKEKGCWKVMNEYFMTTAIDIDRFGNRNFRSLWNSTLRKETGYLFGNEIETISSALGKNQRDNTLTKTGEVLCSILDYLDPNHCKNSINENV